MVHKSKRSKTIKLLAENVGLGEEILCSPPLKNTVNYNYIWNNSLWRGPRNWMNRSSTSRDSTEMSREAEIWCHLGKKHTPRHSVPQMGGSQKYRTLPSGLKDSSSTSGTTTLRSWTGEENPKTPDFRLTGSMSRKTTELERKENSLLKG